MATPSQASKEGVESMGLIKNKAEFKGAVIGMILGDGGIYKHPTTKECYLSVSGTNSEYIKWKCGILEYLTAVKLSSRKNARSDKEIYVVKTRAHPFYTKLWKRFYYNGRKTIHPHLIRCLTPLGFAIWFMDDGTTMRKCGIYMRLCTHSFNYAEHLTLQKVLNDKFQLRFNICRHHKWFYLALKGADRKRFVEIIAPFVVPEMQYKVPTTQDIEKVEFNYKNRWKLHNRNEKGQFLPLNEDVLQTTWN